MDLSLSELKEHLFTPLQKALGELTTLVTGMDRRLTRVELSIESNERSHKEILTFIRGEDGASGLVQEWAVMQYRVGEMAKAQDQRNLRWWQLGLAILGSGNVAFFLARWFGK